MGATDGKYNLERILFSSCAIFFVIVVMINLIPYFPSVSYDLPTKSPSKILVPSPPVLDHLAKNSSGSMNVSTADNQDSSPDSSPLHRDTCDSFLHSIMYKRSGSVFKGREFSWDWVQSTRVSQCGFHKVQQPEASVLVNGSWIVVAGDSECRITYISLLEVFIGFEEANKVRIDITHHHEDYFKTVDALGLKMDFLWRPYVANLTQMVSEFNNTGKYPDLIVMGAGLWDMLYVNQAVDYGRELEGLRDSYLAVLGGGRVPVFWLGMPTLVNPKLNTERKRERLTDAVHIAYDDALRGSKILRQSGGPMFLLDLRLLTDLCGAGCADDGMHYEDYVHDATAQILLNTLAIRSNTKVSTLT